MLSVLQVTSTDTDWLQLKMDSEDLSLISEVKIEIDIAEEPVVWRTELDKQGKCEVKLSFMWPIRVELEEVCA